MKINKFFSITKDEKHIIVWLLGIKMSFLRKLDFYYVEPNKNNNIYVIENGVRKQLTHKIPGLEITVTGSDNTVEIHMPSVFVESFITVHSKNAKITIEQTPRFMFRINCWSGENQRFHFGKNSDCSGLCHCHMVDKDAACIIGEDCMFAGGVAIWASDAHVIYDIDNKEPLNAITKPIIIGNHCWLGHGSTLMKNCQLNNNTVVGTQSVVTKKFDEENIVVGGNPAKVIKRNCNWDRKSIYHYELAKKTGENINA